MDILSFVVGLFFMVFFTWQNRQEERGRNISMEKKMKILMNYHPKIRSYHQQFRDMEWEKMRINIENEEMGFGSKPVEKYEVFGHSIIVESWSAYQDHRKDLIHMANKLDRIPKEREFIDKLLIKHKYS